VTDPRTFVLVHGAWGGGWVWRRVADRLVAGGHRVFAPTLTGLAERSHLAGAGVNLTTHVRDVANLSHWEELADVVLVGHSYGGMVITGVTEAVGEGAIGAAVYLDAFLPADGRALSDYAPLPAVEGFLIPPIPAAPPRTNAADAEWMNRLRTPQPRATFEELVRRTGALERIARKTYVLATGYDSAVFARFAGEVRADPAWRYHELSCGHDVMLAMPDETVEILLEAAGA
jgi:pimeloyl-ACP methyl ester carboxylesterase